MVFAEAAWQLVRWGSFSKDSPRQKEYSAGGPQPWAAFDAADAMERGLLGPRTCAEEDRLVKPPKQEQHLRVRVLKDGAEHRLTDEDGELKLVGLCREKDHRVDIYLASEGTDGTASFTLTFDEDRTEFRLTHVQKTASGDCKGRELLRVAQTQEKIGGGTCIYLDVTVHDIESGASVKLGSKRPVWNKRLKSLTMDFGGRCDKASPRNFQICPLDDEDQTLGGVMFFGKIDHSSTSSTFNMDYVEPLGALHAFAIALSTQHWEG
jgi:hypothetical protein